jgi:SAM-dependent methyltransferase
MSKQSVKDFYDNEGWKYAGANSRDAIINENLTEIASNYVHSVRMRIFHAIGSGSSLLDVGCGPIQYSEYVEYSQNFKTRVCVDLSSEALKLAKEKIGDHGDFIVGDYLLLPTPKSAPFDGATLINVLYHVKREDQEKLVRKILNDLKPGAKLVIVYSNPHSPSAVITKILVQVKRQLGLLTSRKNRATHGNPIYFFRFPLDFWKRFEDQAEVQIRAWRTFSPALEKLMFRKHFFGAGLFRIIFKLENQKWWNRVAEYPIIIMEKR